MQSESTKSPQTVHELISATDSTVSAADRVWLLQELLDCSHSELQFRKREILSAEELVKFKGWLARRETGEPLQYITKAAYFRNLKLEVDRRVLIPRPETEYLVDLAFAAVATTSELAQKKELKCVDIGCGSGAVALAIKQERPTWSVYASDISEDALAVTEMNARANDLEIRSRVGDLLTPWSDVDLFDLVVSNPPYVSQASDLTSEVAQWEPRGALLPDADRDRSDEVKTVGALTAHRLLQHCAEKIARQGISLLELSPGAVHELAKLWHNHERCSSVEVLADLAGRERYLQVRWE